MTAAKAKSDHAALLSLIEQRAPKLIAAGVTAVSIDGLSITLAPMVPSDPTKTPQPEAMAQGHIDPLRDGSTYPNGRVPGFIREDEIP